MPTIQLTALREQHSNLCSAKYVHDADKWMYVGLRDACVPTSHSHSTHTTWHLVSYASHFMTLPWRHTLLMTRLRSPPSPFLTPPRFPSPLSLSCLAAVRWQVTSVYIGCVRCKQAEVIKVKGWIEIQYWEGCLSIDSISHDWHWVVQQTFASIAYWIHQ